MSLFRVVEAEPSKREIGYRACPVPESLATTAIPLIRLLLWRLNMVGIHALAWASASAFSRWLFHGARLGNAYALIFFILES
jgi:hypothetical protein